MTTKAGKQAAKRKARMVKTVSQIQAKRERQVKRRLRLERVRKAISDFDAGRISKTKLRTLVPRSYFA